MQGKFKSLGDYVQGFLSSIERALANVMAQKLTSSVLGASFSSMFGFRAEGGSVTAGQPYIVGEKGYELFIPQASGTIIPNHSLGKPAAGSGSATGGAFNYNQVIQVDNRGNASSQGSGDKSQMALLGQMIHSATKQVILNEQRPGGLLNNGR